ncbi:MAG: HEAT repeat domain-containing protein [Pseudomonadota bacterium]
MTEFHPEQYFPIAFFIIMSLNLLGVAGLVISKTLRIRAKSLRQETIRDLFNEVERAQRAEKYDLTLLRRRIARVPLDEIRRTLEALSKKNRPAVELFGTLLEESGRLIKIAELASRGPRWKRIDSLVILGLLKHTAGLLLLRRALRSTDQDVVLAAVSALGFWDSPQTVETLVSLLGKDCPVNSSRVATMIENTTAHVAGALCRRAQSADPVAQYWCAKLLGKYKTSESLEMVHQLLEHPNTNVRAAAVETLGQIGTPADEAFIVRMLADRDWVVRVNAIHACGEARIKSALPHLVGLFRDRQWWVRADAREAIERIGPEAADHLVEALEDTDKFARNMAAQALDDMGYVDAAIWDLAKQGAPREQALRVLSAIRNADGAPALSEKLYKLDPELFGSVREQLRLAG